MGYDGRARTDHRGNDEVHAPDAGALARDARGSRRVLGADVPVPGSKGLAVDSDDEVGHGAVTVSAPPCPFRVV
jgi:hypothetical protein